MRSHPERRRRTAGVVILAIAGLGIGCKSSKEDAAAAKSSAEVKAEKSERSVRDVCELREKGWARTMHRGCTSCLAMAAAPACGDCKKKPYVGQCARLDAARRAEPSCDDVTACRHRCRQDDCDCIAKCYEGHPKCDALTAAVDACTTEICAEHCR